MSYEVAIIAIFTDPKEGSGINACSETRLGKQRGNVLLGCTILFAVWDASPQTSIQRATVQRTALGESERRRRDEFLEKILVFRRHPLGCIGDNQSGVVEYSAVYVKQKGEASRFPFLHIGTD